MEQMEKLSFLTGEQTSEMKSVLMTLLEAINQDYEQMIGYFHERLWEVEEKVAEKDQVIAKLQEQIVRLQKRYGEASEEMNKKEWMIMRLKVTIERLEKKAKHNINHSLKQIDNQEHNDALTSHKKAVQNTKPTRINISDYFMKASERSQQSQCKQKDMLSNASTFSYLHTSSNQQTPDSLNIIDSTKKQHMKSEIKSFTPSCFEIDNRFSTHSRRRAFGRENASRTALWGKALQGKERAVGQFIFQL